MEGNGRYCGLICLLPLVFRGEVRCDWEVWCVCELQGGACLAWKHEHLSKLRANRGQHGCRGACVPCNHVAATSNSFPSNFACSSISGSNFLASSSSSSKSNLKAAYCSLDCSFSLQL